MDQDFPDVLVDLHNVVAVTDDELVFVLPWFIGQNFLVDPNRFIVVVLGVGGNPVGGRPCFVLGSNKSFHVLRGERHGVALKLYDFRINHYRIMTILTYRGNKYSKEGQAEKVISWWKQIHQPILQLTYRHIKHKPEADK